MKQARNLPLFVTASLRIMRFTAMHLQALQDPNYDTMFSSDSGGRSGVNPVVDDLDREAYGETAVCVRM